ncbi:ran-specific GTPase-activating protein-like [Rhynchophorus ferrugineus]|uniref:ran-specific GTPase-activating protein-like n=1 Tax=Rhynchophorus ferrugineus TaxID=354439 RepID=UPI003FCC3A6D
MSDTTHNIPETPEREQRNSESSDTEHEHDPQFVPIIILPEIHISANEENENEFLKIRAKLYRFDNKTDPPEWKERGTGELKILQHKERNSFRIVMRRDKTLKVCANHFILPWMDLKPSQTNEKAFIYTVLADFADEETKSECLAVKFATVENANIFKTKFEKAKEILKSVDNSDVTNGEDNLKHEALDDNTENNDVITKLSKLDVKEETSKIEKEQDTKE